MAEVLKKLKTTDPKQPNYMNKEFQMKLLTIVSSTVCAAALVLASSSFAFGKKEAAAAAEDMGTKHSKHHKSHGHKHHGKSHKKAAVATAEE